MRISIEAKLAAGVGVMLLLVGVAGGVGYQRLAASDEALHFVDGRSDAQALVLDAKAHAIRAVSNTRAAVIRIDEDQASHFARRATEFRADALGALAKAKTLLLNDAAVKGAVEAKSVTRAAAGGGFALDMGEGDARDADFIRAA